MAFFSQLTKKQGLKLRFKALIISLLILGPAISLADIAQTDYSTSQQLFSDTSSPWPFTDLGTGITGTFGNITLALDDYAGTHTVQLNLWECTSGTTGSVRGVNIGDTAGACTLKDIYTHSVSYTGSAQLITFSNGSGYVANASKYYTINMRTTNDFQGVRTYGTSVITSPSQSFYFYISGVNGGSYPYYSDTSTRIIDFTPADHSTTTSPVTFTLQGYVNPDDIGTFIGVKFTLHNIDQNVLLLSAFSPNDIYFLSGFNATTSGPFNFSSTTPIADGNYRLEAILERSYLSGWFVNPFSPINQDISHQFCIQSTPTGPCGTFIGNMSQNGFNELNQIFASSTATTTSAVAQNCNPFVGQFDIIKCGAFLFIPGGDYLNTTMKGLKDGILTRVPWGYFTRVYTIWNTSATTTLPTFNVSFATGPGDNSNMGTSTLSFDPGDMIAGGGTLLESIKDPVNGKSTKDIFGPLVQLAFALGVIFMIISDLTGSHRHNEEVAKATKLS